MSIAEARLGMTGGHQTDASLFTVMVRGFTARHRSKDYIPRENLKLGTTICHFQDKYLSKVERPGMLATLPIINTKHF
jgi:hypothetical protein